MNHMEEDFCAPDAPEQAVLFPVGAAISTPPQPEPLPEPRQKTEPDRTQLMPFAGGAEISPCGHYRYSLYRRWQEDGKKILFIGVNPSKADGSIDDNTVRRWKSFAQRDGYGEFWVGNVCAYRSTSPKAIKSVAEYQDANNREYIHHMAVDADRIVACYGNNIELVPYWQDFVKWLCLNYEVYCFGLTKRGHPKHPLRLAATTPYSRYCQTISVVEKENDKEFICKSETHSIQEFSEDF